MCARTDQPDPRDQAIARLLADALKPAVSSGEACPDAEFVAAYADQGPVGHDEREQLEKHFAGCARCQRILAALGATLEASAGGAVAVLPAPATVPAAPRPLAQHWLWWLSPAFGAAAAALLWMVLRPAAPAPVQTAADYSRAAEQETRALNAPVAPSAAAEAPLAAALRQQTQSLDSNLTARAEPDAQAKQEVARDEVAALSSAAPAEAAPPAPAARSAAAGNAAAPPSSGIAQRLTEAGQPPSAATLGARTQAAPAPPPPSAAPPLPARQTTQSVTITEEMPLVGGTSATPGGTLSQQSVADLPLSGRNFAQLNLYTFTSPDGSVVWRLGTGGSIERSTDRGQTWQPQATGVTTGLVSGSAASNEVAWVVGRAGVILRTTDGANWQRIAPLEAAAGDWVTVVAYDELRATVVAADLRRFSTADGGSTWTLQ